MYYYVIFNLLYYNKQTYKYFNKETQFKLLCNIVTIVSGYANGMVNESRIMKRSTRKKRLMTIEIFTVIDHTMIEMWIFYLIAARGTHRFDWFDNLLKYFNNKVNVIPPHLRFSRLSKATSEEEKIEDSKKTARYLFTHIMEGVGFKRIKV